MTVGWLCREFSGEAILSVGRGSVLKDDGSGFNSPGRTLVISPGRM